ncbi:MAG: DJ-1/PfpI family protein, partial [Planctomycetota bacterium]
MSLHGKKIIVLLEQQYQEMEVWYPYYRLKEAGAEVVMVGPEANHSYPSKLGYPAKSEVAARDINPSNFDGIIIPGGFAPDFIRRSEAMIKLVSVMAEQGKMIAAICHGPWVLC